MPEDYMCPFCVTPWKCNGPHIEEDDLPEFEAYIAWVRSDERGKWNTPYQNEDWNRGYRQGYEEGLKAHDVQA